ncbi:MAG: DUF3237 domain-containing protein [Deltaproteobacteria bacterium]|nr:DUF3237 domain-containing protein [Deltaproteobacteria bacterium]
MYSIKKLEHLCSYKAKITEVINFGMTPLGRRLDVCFDGDLAGDLLSGRMRGVDYILVRSDGVGEIHVRGAITTKDGVNISVEISGYGDENGDIRDAHVKFLTGHEKYQWLTSKIVVGKGKSANGQLEFDYYYEP